MAYVYAPKENWVKIEEPYYDLVRVEKGSLKFGAQCKRFYTRNKFKVIPLKLFYYQTFFETWHD